MLSTGTLGDTCVAILGYLTWVIYAGKRFILTQVWKVGVQDQVALFSEGFMLFQPMAESGKACEPFRSKACRGGSPYDNGLLQGDLNDISPPPKDPNSQCHHSCNVIQDGLWRWQIRCLREGNSHGTVGQSQVAVHKMGQGQGPAPCY